MCPQRICVYIPRYEEQCRHSVTPHIFTPDKVPIITPHESQQLHGMTIPTLQRLDNLNSRLVTSLHTMDIDSLIHVHQNSRGSQTEVRCHTVVIILSFISVLLGVGYLLIRSHCGKLWCAATKTPDNESVTSPPQHRTPEPQPRNTDQNVVFSTYSVQHASWDSRARRISGWPWECVSDYSKRSKTHIRQHGIDFVLMT